MELRCCITYMYVILSNAVTDGAHNATCMHSQLYSLRVYILLASLLQFVSLVMEEISFHIEMPAKVCNTSEAYHPIYLYTLAVMPILLLATVGLFLVLYIHHSWGLVVTVLARSQVARHTMKSTMLASWVLLLWMMEQFYTATKAMAEAVQEKGLLTLFQDIYIPQVTVGYVQWGSFLAILLLEAPVLCIFFFRKATDLHNRRQQLSKTDCRLCYWITVLCDTLGNIGVVAAIQIASVHLFYSTLYLTVSPIFALAGVSDWLAYTVVFLVCTTMLMQMVSSCCKTRSFGRIIKGLAFILLGLFCIAINYYLVEQMRDKEYNNDAFHGVLISVVPSLIIGIYGYTVKRLLHHKKDVDVEGAERENQELEPLIN